MEDELRNGEELLASREIPVTFWIGEGIRCLTIIGIPFALLNVIRVLTNSFAVTNKRVFGKVGLFGTSSYDVALDKLNSVKSAQGIIGKLLNYGHLIVTDNSGDDYFILCAAPAKFKKLVFEIQEQYKEEQMKKMAASMKAS